MPHRQGPTTNLKKRFFLWSAIILMGGGLLLSGLFFWNTRRLLMAEAMAKSEVILREVEAIRTYVKEQLRPKMYEIHGQDVFIIEAMSTTYVSTRIMASFAETMPDYIYRRASLNPHNKDNLADSFEEKMFDWFEEDPGRTFWQGMVPKNGDVFFISMVPDYFYPACIRCHGKVDDAPQSLIEKYGTDGGFRFQAGDLAGINSVAVPVSASLRQAWQGSVAIFLVTLGASVVWLWLLNLVFQRLVIERLGAMISFLSEEKAEDQAAASGDEIDVLHASIGSLHSYVRSARKGSGLQPNFISDYVVTKPIIAGAMSWMYAGRRVDSGDKAALKIGYEEVLKNPLYRACFETELKLFQTFSHPSLLGAEERIEDVLVMDEVMGRSVISLLEKDRLDDQLLPSLFLQLCDLAASLHAAGIVHHDLRPHVMMLEDRKLQLIDMGFASSDRQSDPIVAAGLGPQGDFLFMAPEQIQGKRGDPRSDIYTIGVLLHFAVTGHLPLAERRRSAKKWLHLKKEPANPRQYRAGLSAAMEQVIVQALAYEAKERYQWVEDLMEDFERAVQE